MISTIEPVVDTPEEAPAKKLVKLSVTIEEAEFNRDIDAAFRVMRSFLIFSRREASSREAAVRFTEGT